MTAQDISRYRISAQKIADTPFTNPKDLVAYMGAMQAQDYPMARWAVGLRLKQATDESILTAVDKGEIIRTHIMRPTWHLVSPDDIYWMLELTAPQIHALSKSRHKQLEITPALIRKCNRMFEKALENSNHCTREELVALLVKAKIPLDDNRAAHLLFCAELDEVICSGARKINKPTYALLAERVPKAKRFSRVESMTMLVERYFISHGPATLYDFVWWSGLSVTDAKHAIEAIKSQFHTETIEGQQYFFSDMNTSVTEEPSLHLLPAYDEFLISYKDRSPSLSPSKNSVTTSINGIFYPLIVLNGHVIGTWKRAKKSNKVLLDTALFQKPTKHMKTQIAGAAKRYATFLDLEVIVQ